MADFVKDRGGSPENTKAQERSKENYERSLPAWIRDGKEIRVKFTSGDALTLEHFLGRVPRGWIIQSAGSADPNSDEAGSTSPHAIVEVLRNDQEIRLINNYGGAGDLTAVLWIW